MSETFTTGVNAEMNKLELEANTCNRRQVQENGCEQGKIVFSLTSHWFENMARIMSTNYSVLKRNQGKREITFDF